MAPVRTYRLHGWIQLALLFILILLTSTTGGSERDSARKQCSHFPIDLHCQPSQNCAQLYSECGVSVITGLIKIFLLKVNWSIGHSVGIESRNTTDCGVPNFYFK